MKIRCLLYVLTFWLCACSSPNRVIPKSAYMVAEDANVAVFLNQEDTNDIPQVSLWMRYKKTKEEKMLLLTHPNSRRDWQTYEGIMSISIDSISTISRVTILSYGNEPIRLLVEGCPDYRNVESFIVSDNNDTAICLPTTNGLIGITQEESLLIMESYEYYEEGGRYSRIDAFDRDGNPVSSMFPRLNTIKKNTDGKD